MNEITSTGYLDSHCHLQASSLIPVVDGMMKRAGNAGVHRMFCNATREEDWQAVVDLAANKHEIIPFMGIHPWYAETAGAGWEDRLRFRLEQIPAGIGEVGLDKCCRADFGRQQQIFLTQLQMAAKLRRPLVIHCVRAWGRMLELLEQFPEPLPPVMIHAFAGSLETLQRLIRIGCFISFSSRLATNNKVHTLFLATPLASLLLETDSQGRASKRSEAMSPSVAGVTNAAGRIDAPARPGSRLPSDSYNQQIIYNEPADIIKLYQLATTMRRMALPEFRQEIWKNGEIFTNPILPR